MSSKPRKFARAATSALFTLGLSGAAWAADPTPGFPEPVVQWGVQKGETCEDIARALYGDAKHAVLLQRYNRIVCAKGHSLPEGLTLVLPEKPNALPDARLRSMNPDVEARAPGGSWSPASTGQPLRSSTSVHTQEAGRADIQFIDRTRVFLAPNTLVVIYGTASQTAVSKTPPPAVEIEQGEVRAGLAALRGGSADIAVKGGGRVNATSRDAVVERKGQRTTVAVFDGKADVSAGGKTVNVPLNHGTRFVGNTPPVPPRPLPPAPAWDRAAPDVVLTNGAAAILTATWKPIEGAKAYRVELSRDEEMHDLVAREEVGPEITRFRAEKMPAGVYFIAVRAIDKEEYLGIADKRRIVVVNARIEGAPGAIGDGVIDVSSYGTLVIESAPDIEAALDDDPFAALENTRVELGARAPKRLRLRQRGSQSAGEMALQYKPVSATIAIEGGGAAPNARVTLEGIEGLDVPTQVAPKLIIKRPEGDEERALTIGADGSALASLAAPKRQSVRLMVIDRRGRTLADFTGEIGPSADAAPTETSKPKTPRIGVVAPLWTQTTTSSVAPWSPIAPNAAVVGTAVGLGDATGGSVGYARASGSLGPLGFEAAVRSDVSDNEALGDSAAWGGVRWAAYRAQNDRYALGPSVRVGFPVTSDGPPLRLEPGLAVGGVSGPFGWFSDVGARIRAMETNDRAIAPNVAAFLLGGVTYDLAEGVRGSALVDLHVLGEEPPEGGSFRGGVGLGIEAGDTVFVGFSSRLSPWSDGEGHFTLGLGVGVREP